VCRVVLCVSCRLVCGVVCDRLVELIIPSLMFGGVYLQYGLVPSIVLHFVFDVVWFALPLFASPSRFDQGLVILCALAPLWLVLAKRFILKRPAHVSNVRYIPPHHLLLTSR